MLTILIPAHNEGSGKQKKPQPTRPNHRNHGRLYGHLKSILQRIKGDTSTGLPQIVETLQSLEAQTVRPDRIIVIADNCDDDTEALALAAGVEVFRTVMNTDKKAGALNQWLDSHLTSRPDDDLIMVMDADSSLNPDFLKNALKYIDKGYHAVGGVFLGKLGGGFIGMLQRNEYARYARDVARKDGKTLVLTGTATVFTAYCLKDVVDGRATNKIPRTGSVSHVYDTKALTEDNELTFALLHLGYKIIAPAECGLTTEVMEKWGQLWRQRYRWKRGAIENNWHYGFTSKTAKYWGLQLWGILGIIVTATYLSTLTIALVLNELHWYPVWIIVTVVYVLERAVTVAKRGTKQVLLAASLIIEMPYDIYLQAVQAWALASSIMRTRKSW
jgi:biofilm PGA synthesis N-glycosyltransferase PgaC